MSYDIKAVLDAMLSQLQEAHRKQPDAIVLVSDLSQPEDREGADKIDPILSRSAKGF